MITSYRNITYRETDDKYRVKLNFGNRMYDRSFKKISSAIRFRDSMYELYGIKIKK